MPTIKNAKHGKNWDHTFTCPPKHGVSMLTLRATNASVSYNIHQHKAHTNNIKHLHLFILKSRIFLSGI